MGKGNTAFLDDNFVSFSINTEDGNENTLLIEEEDNDTSSKFFY